MQKQVGKYLLVQEIGEGQFGKVYKALDTENQNRELAVKVIPREKAIRQPQVWKLLQSEIEIMRKLNHPHLLNLIDFLETGSNYYMILPFCKDGDLDQRVKKLGKIDENEGVFYLQQIMSGFVYLYQNKIMHRDFKLANVFINGDQLIIGDFGFSKQGCDVANTKLGTPFTMAPEIMFSTGRSYYTSKADLWAIGVAYYHMLFGCQPFQANSMPELQNLIINFSGSKVRFPPHIPVSEESKNLIKGLLEFDHNKRMNWQQFFNHPLFEKTSVPLDTNPHHNVIQNQTSNQTGQPAHPTHPQYYSQPQGANPYIVQPDTTPPTPQTYVYHNVAPANQTRPFTVLVHQHFLQEKSNVNNDHRYSHDFEIPVPGEKQEVQANPTPGVTLPVSNQVAADPNQKSPRSMNSSSKNQAFFAPSSTVTPGEFYQHERDKGLAVLQASKRWIELSKINELYEKRGISTLLSILLCKKGLFLNDMVCAAILNKQETQKLTGFEEYCSSAQAEKLVQD